MHLPVSSSTSSAFPRTLSRSASRVSPSKRFHDGSPFRDCSHFVMFRPSGLLASQIVPTAAAYRRRAAEAFTSELNRLRCLRLHRICLPPAQAIGGVGTYTPLDSQPCRLLQCIWGFFTTYDGEAWYFTRDGFREVCGAMRDTRLHLSGTYLVVANCGTRTAVDRSHASASRASFPFALLVSLEEESAPERAFLAVSGPYAALRAVILWVVEDWTSNLRITGSPSSRCFSVSWTCGYCSRW